MMTTIFFLVFGGIVIYSLIKINDEEQQKRKR